MPNNERPNDDKPSKAVIIAALIGGFCAIIAALIGTFKEPLTELIFNSPSLNAPNDSNIDLTFLTGVWGGEFKTDYAGPWDILLTLNGNCRINEICGTIQFDQASCTASVTIVSAINNRFDFIVEKVGEAPECLPVDYQYFEYIGNDTMNYFVGWTDTEGLSVKGYGVLNRIR